MKGTDHGFVVVGPGLFDVEFGIDLDFRHGTDPHLVHLPVILQ